MIAKIEAGQVGATLIDAQKRTAKAIQTGLKVAAHRGRTLLIEASPADTGAFRQAWAVQTTGGAVKLVNHYPIAGVIELGARPHAVSRAGQEAIAAWVKRHQDRFLKAGQSSLTKAEIRSIVYGICKDLKENGQKGHYVVRKNLDTLTKYAIEEVNRQVAKLGTK